MSQAKVDQHKKDKANRKQQMKKDKMKKRISLVISAVIGLAVVGWVGYSVYDYIDSNKVIESVDVNYDSVNDYLSEIN